MLSMPGIAITAGGGSEVCERWRSFAAFLADLGLRPGREYTLGRIDPEGDYEPRNCSWATWPQQRRNMSRVVRVEWCGAEVACTSWRGLGGWRARRCGSAIGGMAGH